MFFGDRIGLGCSSDRTIGILEVVIDRSDAVEVISGEGWIDVVLEGFWNVASTGIVIGSDQVQRMDFRIDIRAEQQTRQRNVFGSDGSEIRRSIKRGTQAHQGDR